ncbi:acriflavin resistance protein [Catellatospora sp. TT07R-123]|uniref:ABC transporter permease n=1 Tax=Catellatospora sp. TT07R-123 TaxID=2733863 RepID=UPI001B140D5F|nr:ABC transporter permease [Catellatospora sp. TT07R-123]GHJ46907.1 acriflavin resistance protein [Catellatospora sp. TT07R-123]
MPDTATIAPTSGPGAAPAASGRAPARTRRRNRPANLLATAPLLAFAAVFFGLPLLAVLVGAFTTTDRATGATAFTTGNLTRSVQGAYRDAMVSSIGLSLTTAAIGVVLGTLLAQAVVASRLPGLRNLVVTASGVLANFGGVPLAFAFIATLGISGVVTESLHLTGAGWNLYTPTGLGVVYLYFLIPLMVLVIAPALDGLRPQWREAAANCGATGAQYWRHVGLPVLWPSLLGGFVLLFGTAFAAYATAAAMVGSVLPLVTLQIADALSGNVLVGQEGVASALALDMIAVAVLVMAVYLPLQRRSARWLR